MHPYSYSIVNIMKNLNKAVVILLNILFCGITLYFFTHNAFLRPYAGSFFKEFVSCLLLLGALYVNYFILYPKIHQKRSHTIYWLTLVCLAAAVGLVDFAIAYPYIISHNIYVIQLVGFYSFFSKTLFFIVGRNLSLNFIPYLLRERQYFRQSLEKEVRVVYQNVRKLDVMDKDSNIHLVDIDDILYCHQIGNYTEIYMIQNKKYLRLGSMKHLEQLFGEDDFIRITTTILVPFRFIASYQDNMVTLKKMSWEEEPAAFMLESKSQKNVVQRISDHFQKCGKTANDKNIPQETNVPKIKRKPAIPPEEKIKKVLSYIKAHPICNSADIIAETNYSLSTVERCLSELKNQGLIKHTGSKKKGGYAIVNTRQKKSAKIKTS